MPMVPNNNDTIIIVESITTVIGPAWWRLDGLAFLDEKQLVTALGDGSVVLWEPKTGKRIKSFGHGEGIRDLSVAAAAQRMASVTTDSVRIWDLKAGGSKTLKSDGQEFTAVALSADGKRLAIGRSDGAVPPKEKAIEKTQPRIRAGDVYWSEPW